jgi:hypothetical protein
MDELLIVATEGEVLREIGKTPYEPQQEENEELALRETTINKHFQMLNALLQFMVF